MDAGRMGMSLLKNSSFVLLLSILFGLIWPGPAQSTEMLITPVLMIMMAFSLTDVNLSATLGQVSLKSSMLGLALNYGLLSGLILLLSHSLQDEALRQGFIVMAACPQQLRSCP